MSQLDIEQITQEISAPQNDNLPAAGNDQSFIATADQKVELDLEDAPYLQENKPEEPKQESEKPAEKKAEKEKSSEESEEEAPKSKKKMILILLIGVIVLAGLGVGAYLFFGSTPTINSVTQQNFIVVPSKPTIDIKSELEISLDPFWIELPQNDNNAKFLVATFVLKLSNTEVRQEIEVNMNIVRDAIYYYFVNAEVNFLMDHQNTEMIKNGMMEIINQYIVTGQVTDIYFESFLYK